MERAKILHAASRTHDFDVSRVVPCFSGYAVFDRAPFVGVRDALAADTSATASTASTAVPTSHSSVFGFVSDAIADSPLARPIVFESLCALLIFMRAGEAEYQPLLLDKAPDCV